MRTPHVSRVSYSGCSLGLLFGVFFHPCGGALKIIPNLTFLCFDSGHGDHRSMFVCRFDKINVMEIIDRCLCSDLDTHIKDLQYVRNMRTHSTVRHRFCPVLPCHNSQSCHDIHISHAKNSEIKDHVWESRPPSHAPVNVFVPFVPCHRHDW